MYSQARLAVSAAYMTVHVLLACRYAVLYWEMRQSLFVVTRGLSMLIINLSASVISVLACCLRQIAADTLPDSPLAFTVSCKFMELATLCMIGLLFPSVIDRGVVLVVKFDPSLRQRYGNYITTRHRGRVLVVYATFGCLLCLIPELLDAECVVRGCDHPNCIMGSNLVALFPLSFLQFIVVSVLAYRLSLIDLQQEGLGIKDELYLHVILSQFLLAPSLAINLLMQFGVLKNKDIWEFIVGLMQTAGLAVALYASHILPSLRLGFAPEPLASFYFGPRISPEGESGSSLSLHRRRSSMQLRASLRGEGALLSATLRQNLLAEVGSEPPFTRQGSSPSSDATPRSPSGRMLVRSPSYRAATLLSADAPLLRGARVSPAFDRWDLQLEQWLSLESSLQVHLDHPAVLEYLKEAAHSTSTPVVPHGSPGSFSNTSPDSSRESAAAKGRTSITIGTVPGLHSSLAEANTPQDANATPAVDVQKDPEVASVASLLDVARSALQEEAVRFVLAVLVMRSLDPKEKTHRETIRQHCQFLLATHFDLKTAHYRLDVSHEAETAVIREVQKLGRRAVLFADDVSRTMHSFDAAFTQVWPAVYELLANHCFALSIMEAQFPTFIDVQSVSGDSKTESPTVKGRARMGSLISRSPSHRNSHSGTAEGGAGGGSSLPLPFAAAGLALALAQRLSLSRPSDASNPPTRRSSAERSTGPDTDTDNPLTVVSKSNELETLLPDAHQSRQHPPLDRDTGEEAPLQHRLDANTHAARHRQSMPAQRPFIRQDPQESPSTIGPHDTQAPSVNIKARQPSLAPLHRPPSVRRMSTGGIFTNTPNPTLWHPPRLAAGPPSTSPKLDAPAAVSSPNNRTAADTIAVDEITRTSR